MQVPESPREGWKGSVQERCCSFAPSLTPLCPRKEGEDTRTALETVRGMPETALVFAFLCSFGEALKLPRTSVHVTVFPCLGRSIDSGCST